MTRNLLFKIAPFLLYGIFSVLAFQLYTANNDFPFYSHADEPGKIVQVLRKKRNFHHPTFMLDATGQFLKIYQETGKILLKLEGVKEEDARFQRLKKPHAQVVVQLGRDVNAFWMVLAFLILCLTGHLVGGPLYGMVAAMVMLAEPRMTYYAHFLKEEPVFLLGIVAIFAASLALVRSPNRLTICLFAFSCAFVLSGKYVGALFLGVVLVFVGLSFRGRKVEPGGRLHPLRLGSIVFVLSWVVLNYPLVLSWGDFQAGFSREWKGVTEGHLGFARSRAFWTYRHMLLQEVSFPMWLLLPLALALPWLDRARRNDYALILSAGLIYFLVIALSPKDSGRYILPVHVLMHLGGALALAWLASLAWRSHLGKPWRIGTGSAALIILTWLLLADFKTNFQNLAAFGKGPTALAMRKDVKQRLPKEAVIAQVDWRLLPDDNSYKPSVLDENADFAQKVITDRSLPDLGSIQPMIEKGITHMAVTENHYYRYLNLGEQFHVISSQAAKTQAQKRQRFYQELFHQGTIVTAYNGGRISEIQRKGYIIALPTN